MHKKSRTIEAIVADVRPNVPAVIRKPVVAKQRFSRMSAPIAEHREAEALMAAKAAKR